MRPVGEVDLLSGREEVDVGEEKEGGSGRSGKGKWMGRVWDGVG